MTRDKNAAMKRRKMMITMTWYDCLHVKIKLKTIYGPVHAIKAYKEWWYSSNHFSTRYCMEFSGQVASENLPTVITE